MLKELGKYMIIITSFDNFIKRLGNDKQFQDICENIQPDKGPDIYVGYNVFNKNKQNSS